MPRISPTWMFPPLKVWHVKKRMEEFGLSEDPRLHRQPKSVPILDAEANGWHYANRWVSSESRWPSNLSLTLIFLQAQSGLRQDWWVAFSHNPLTPHLHHYWDCIMKLTTGWCLATDQQPSEEAFKSVNLCFTNMETEFDVLQRTAVFTLKTGLHVSYLIGQLSGSARGLLFSGHGR